MKHALIIGGTGMLRGAALQLLREFDTVSVLARTRSRLESLQAEVGGDGGRVNPICLDWVETDRLRAGVGEAVERFGPISLVVSWVHSSAPDVPLVVAGLVEDAAVRPLWFQIYGTNGEVSEVGRGWHRDLSGRPGLRYRRVRLGSVEDGGERRWLSNREISDGVLLAIVEDSVDSVVGD